MLIAAAVVFLGFNSGLARGMAADPSLRPIPVVMMSSLPEATVAERCVSYTAFLRNPFMIADVVSLTKRLTSRS